MDMDVIIVFQLGMLIGALIYVGRILDGIKTKMDEINPLNQASKDSDWLDSKVVPST